LPTDAVVSADPQPGTIDKASRFLRSGGGKMATNTTHSDTERPVVTTTTRAREGVTGHGVRYVLLLSTGLVALIFLGLWLYYFGH
jgi:hypothetical protein